MTRGYCIAKDLAQAWQGLTLSDVDAVEGNALNAPRSLSTMDEPFRIANGMTISSDDLWHDSLPQSMDDDTPKQLIFGQDFFPPPGKLSMSAANGLRAG
ncbi:uncharacterized protein P174DRAFT_449300 [Aspergillus novofumigatus IBT 16806]|uniref:Uncharacterized protein n=1 Tax=Aspergillus novofumigatus (strain IBT 16806) TaxID=1392255 RepID=A0A2I1CJC7_ASPN1|nr:uncharacterized protein P174DRAFT_449300 [Aspergillus novofumigatus IBT 16806]PKX97720.1 hypothetical protein P174DRAFT_449300 [Aspergillus novofumigatus IBT 16806]